MWKALALMFVAMACIPAGDTAGKLLTSVHGLEPVFVAWARFALGTLVLAPFAPRQSWALLRDWRIWARSLLLVGGILSIVTALSTAPVANVFAAFFVGPIVSFALSALCLGERISLSRSLMMALGFVGVLMVVRPGFDTPDGIGLAFLAGLFYGGYLTASRALTGRAPPHGLVLTQLAVGTIVLAPLAIWRLPEITPAVGGLLMASGLFSMAGNLLLLMAYRIGTASAIAPLVYFQLIAATLLGWWVFGDLPTLPTWAGLVLILGSGVASARLGRAGFNPSIRPAPGSPTN